MSASPAPPASDFVSELRAAAEWWRLSGVDCDFHDDVTDWLAEETQVAKPDKRGAPGPPDPEAGAAMHDARSALRRKEPERLDLFAGEKPGDLAEFRRWWLEAPGLDAIGPRGRIPPRGEAGAALMVLVVDPEQSDGEVLLDGPQGRLLANMLAAMGVPAERTYIASALPRHTPVADTGSIAAWGMDAVVSHHIELASPQKLLAFGAGILPLLGIDANQTNESLRALDAKYRSTPLLVSEGLDAMMAMPRLKARFWRRYLDWSRRV